MLKVVSDHTLSTQICLSADGITSLINNIQNIEDIENHLNKFTETKCLGVTIL